MEAFFDKLTEDRKSAIEAACIDRSGSNQSMVNEQIPKADIVYDHFQLRMNINVGVDEVPRQEWGKATKTQRKFIEGSRYILLANEENLDDQGSAKLVALQDVNTNIATAYFLKQQFRIVHTYRYPAWAKKAL